MEPYLQGADVVVFETPNMGLTNMILAGAKGSEFYKCSIAQLMSRQTMWHHTVCLCCTEPIAIMTFACLAAGSLQGLEDSLQLRPFILVGHD